MYLQALSLRIRKKTFSLTILFSVFELSSSEKTTYIWESFVLGLESGTELKTQQNTVRDI